MRGETPDGAERRACRPLATSRLSQAGGGVRPGFDAMTFAGAKRASGFVDGTVGFVIFGQRTEKASDCSQCDFYVDNETIRMQQIRGTSLRGETGFVPALPDETENVPTVRAGGMSDERKRHRPDQP
jgi:hypothetical protein